MKDLCRKIASVHGSFQYDNSFHLTTNVGVYVVER